MECEICKSKATVHVSRVVNGVVVERHLCEKCAREIYGLNFKGKISINNTLKGIIELMKEDGSASSVSGEQVCSECGMTYSEFRESGRMGCGACYRCFSGSIGPIIRKMQRSDSHVGKVPKKGEAAFSTERSISQYRLEMNQAVKVEDFERAAELRDAIIELESKNGRNEVDDGGK